MKAPDLTVIDDAGVHPWNGGTEALKSAATHAHLRFAPVDLAKAHDRAALFAELDRALALPEHFGHNFDALADVLEDRDWLGKKGVVVTLLHAAAYRAGHPTEWHTLEELFAEACDYWRERQVPFWVFLA